MARRVGKAVAIGLCVFCRNYVHEECIRLTSKDAKKILALHVQLKKEIVK